MCYNQTILNSDRYSLYITIIKSDNNNDDGGVEALQGRRESGTM